MDLRESTKAAAQEAAAVSRKVTLALKETQFKKGVLLKDLKKFLKDEKKMDVKEASANIQMALKKKMDKGEVVKLEGGLYKLRDPEKAKRPAAEDHAPAAGSKRPAKQAKASAAEAKGPAGDAKKPAKAEAKTARKPVKAVPKIGKVAKAEDQGPERASGASAVPELGAPSGPLVVPDMLPQ